MGYERCHSWALGFLILCSCTATRPADPERGSGFLSNYDRLRSEDPDRADLWVHPDFRPGMYKGAIVPKVEFWLSPSNLDSVDKESLGMIAGLYHRLVVEKLEGAGWSIETEPGPETAVFQLALTELRGAPVAGSVLTGIPYLGKTVVQLLAIGADVHLYVGDITAELRILDSVSNEPMVEALDRRVGAHSIQNIGSTWADVKDALELWTDRIEAGLARNRKP